MKQNKHLHVAILTIAEALPYSIMGPLDILRSSAVLSAVEKEGETAAHFEVELVGETTELFTTYNGVKIQADSAMQEGRQYDLIWIPSLVISPEGLLNRRPAIQQWLQQQFENGAEIVSVCTGAFLLAETGLLDGKKATTHWAYADCFRRLYPAVDLQPQLSLVDNGRIRCAAAGTAWHDMAMTVMEQKLGKRMAVQVSKLFLLQFHVNGQQHLVSSRTTGSVADTQIEKAQRWLLAHLSEENLVQRAAQEMQWSESTFKRRFKQAMAVPPSTWVQQRRVEKAKEALEMTQQTVDDISLQVGYQDSSFFRRLFKRETGLSPAQYRKAFSG